jgi:NADH-quinone oxidoreductase subunit A
MNLPENYIPILIQAAVGLGFVIISLLGAHFLGPKQKKGNSVKNQAGNVELL